MRQSVRIFFQTILSVTFIFYGVFFVEAVSRVDELKENISSQEQSIKKIEAEIAEHENELKKVGKEKTTLESKIGEINLSIRKNKSEINLTQNQIGNSIQRIGQLSSDISGKEQQIKRNKDALAESIRLIHAQDNRSFVELFFAYDSLSEFWSILDEMARFEGAIYTATQDLKTLRADLETNKEQESNEVTNLQSEQEALRGKQEVLKYTQNEKEEILRVTENKEENYKKILAEKQRLKEAFEKEIRSLEEELRLQIDPESIPKTRQGILLWPLDDPYLTQTFGDTEFSRTNPQVYKGKGHNGIDLRASIGTPIKSALAGTVTAVGDTDAVRGCYSYGKWILVRHDNGLSTLYAHLSVIMVASGQMVETGGVIGYSGNTGYSTGPHLHFTVYATQGVQVQQFSKSINCKNASIPIADLRAYINPLVYLPEI